MTAAAAAATAPVQCAAHLLLGLVLTAGPPSGGEAGGGPGGPAVVGDASTGALDRYSRRFEEWSRLDRRGLARLDLAEVRDTVESSFSVRGRSRDDVDHALVELLASSREALGDPTTDAIHGTVLQAVRQRLNGRGGSGFEAFLLSEFLDAEAEAEPALQAAACDALGTSMRGSLVPRLAEAANGPHEQVRLAALRALVGFTDLEASRTLVAACERRTGDEGRRARLLLGRHVEQLETVGATAGSWSDELDARLPAAVLPLLVDADWRTASRGTTIARRCPFEAAAPRLIEALFTWERRERLVDEPSGLVGLRRVRHEISDLLRAGSGMTLGIDPRAWMQWWRASSSGAGLPSIPTRSVAPDFFGLELRSGAVAFVLDASGSMDHPVPGRYEGDSGPTRYEEALEQLRLALERMPDPSAFQVVLFNDAGRRWSEGARFVDDRSRSSVRAWLRRRPPSGGTNLSSGLDALLPRDRDGFPEPERMDVDTVVVLCDGETSEDARWARDWLATYNRTARLVFHCVQIGGSRANALQALAEGTGGDFVRVGTR